MPAALRESLHKHFPEVKAPTKIQRNMLALLNSDLSLLVKSDAGTGKSLATAIFLLSFVGIKFKSDKPYITNLLVVPTADLAEQYMTIFRKMLKDSPLSLHKIVQCIYRSDEATEATQMNLLKDFPAPKILVGTPQRILDILSTPEHQGALPLNNLSCIALDEVDQLLPKKGLYKDPTTLRHTLREANVGTKVPTQILLNHIIPWRNANVKMNNDYFTPLRVLFESSTASGYPKLIALSNNWIKGRPMIRLGLDELGGEKTKRLPRDVTNYFVTYDSYAGILRDTTLPLFDDDVVNDATFLEAVKDINERRRKELLQQSKKENKAKEEKILKFAQSLKKLLESDTSGKRALVVIPESFSILAFMKTLKEHTGVNAMYSKFVGEETGIVYNNEQGKLVKVDPQTIFTKDASEELPRVLIHRAKAVSGLDFPGLQRIYGLSWDSILSSKLYTNLAGRIRAAPIDERGVTSEARGLWRPKEDPEQGRFVVVSLDSEENEEHQLRLGASMARIDALPEAYCT